MTTPSERRTLAALANTVDVSDEVTSRAIAAELYEFGQRAWALRARITDLRDIEATFYVSSAMLDLLRKYGLDIGAGPGGMFERGPTSDKLFGIDAYVDPGDERSRDIRLELTDRRH